MSRASEPRRAGAASSSHRRASRPVRRNALLAASLALVAAAAIGSAIAGVTPSSTTTTTFHGTTTTTMFVPTDVTGGGTFEGSFPKFSFDAYSFTLEEPLVIVAEVTNGFGGCPGDTIVELRQPGAPGNCNGEYGEDLPCIAVDDDSGISLCSKLVYYITEPGEYELRVSAYRNGQIPRYFIDIEFVEIECGNGVLELTEDCDDGNNTTGDCCSPTCAADAAGTPCSDNVFCNGADTCNASAVCANHAGDPCPGPDGDGNCAETCNEAADACNGTDPNDTACQDGVFCNGVDQCSGGACSVHAGDPCPGPDGDGNCAERCNEAADACTLADPNGAGCNDGVFCNGSDTCSGGACSGHAGNPCPGADGDVDCSEACDETADACSGNDPNGSACEDDLFCNGADTCSGGLCSQHGGSACPGVDGDADCTESCSDSAEGCTGNDPNGAPCDDGIFCNGADTCLNGACSQHAGNPCPGADGDANCSESCSEASDACTAPDTNGSACSDGTFCNGADTCSAGACTGHAGNPCPGADGDGNCAESCSESADACTAPDPEGSVCVDGLFCNGPDSCSSGFCNQHAGDPCPGGDGDQDCSETCSETADACTGNDPNGSVCNDALFCNGADTCTSGVCSVHAGNPCPGPDGDIDCSETCSETTDSCTANDPNNTACNDFEFCNGSDKCQSGACSVHTGNPCAPPDGDANCSESCEETSETCTGPDPNGSPCNDNLFCTGSDTCSGGTCSIHLGSPCPGPDGDAGCSESCNEAADSCNAPDPDGSPCVDELFCNNADTCVAGACTAHAMVPCGDSNPCTTDACSEGDDSCSHTPIQGCTTTTLPAGLCGDVSGDGSVKAGDALFVLRAAVGGNQCAAEPCICDANGNGALQASDALLVLRAAVGAPVSLVCSC
jgi:hypothetical protein